MRERLQILSWNSQKNYRIACGLLRDGDCVYAGYEEFRGNISELNFLRPQDRDTANIEQIMIDAYNFLVLHDEDEERRYSAMGDDL